MAAVIHSLWEKGDRNPLILTAHVSIDDPRVQSELTRYLSDNWVPVIEKDVDGAAAAPRTTGGTRTWLSRNLGFCEHDTSLFAGAIACIITADSQVVISRFSNSSHAVFEALPLRMLLD